MSIFKNLFGRSNETTEAPKPDTPTKPTATPPSGEMVKVFDQFGRQLQMPKEAWRKQVLGPNLARKRNDPEALGTLIVNALQDGCAEDVLESARHLTAIDPQPLRAASLLGIVLLQLKRPDEAKALLEEAVLHHGEQGHLLTNLAKAYSALGDAARSYATLWHALELDPNQENALLWFATIEKQNGGAAAEEAAFERVALLPASWRAQIWLARAALGQGDINKVTVLYRQVLSRVNPVPADALMQISGDLGSHGHLQLMLDLCEPIFDLQRHGIRAGNNLIKANLDLGRTKEARTLVERLYAQQRPDWRETLLDWERRIDDAERKFGPVEGELKVGLLSLDEPLCTHGRLGFEVLLPEKDGHAPRVTFLCGTVTRPGPEATQAYSQRTDLLGQVARTVPMYLAEEIHLGSTVQGRMLVTVVEGGSFALLGEPWHVERLETSIVDSAAVVLLHVDARTTPWTLQFSLVDWHKKLPLAEWSATLNWQSFAETIQATYERLGHELRAISGFEFTPNSSTLLLPGDKVVQRYLSALECALVIGTASMRTGEQHAIWGERALIDNLLDLAVSVPTSIRCRILLLNALEKEARRRPDIVREYLEKLSLLRQRHPLPPGSASDVIERAVSAIHKAVATN